MIIPENLTLEEYIGVLKAELQTLMSTAHAPLNDEDFNKSNKLSLDIYVLEIFKRKFDSIDEILIKMQMQIDPKEPDIKYIQNKLDEPIRVPKRYAEGGLPLGFETIKEEK